mgnify:CR=1 FL=1
MVRFPFPFISPSLRSGQAPVTDAAGDSASVHILQDEQGLAAADGQGIAEITQSQEIPGLQRLAGLSGSFRQEPLGQDEIFR